MGNGTTRVAVVGHVEWTTIARAEHVPRRGEVIHADIAWEGPAGGGAVAAVQLAALAGECTFFTALGDDRSGARTRELLGSLGVRVLAAKRDGPTRGAVSLVDDTGERTTTTLGPRLQPATDDPLPWDTLAGYDAVHFVAGDVGVLRTARRAPVLVATTRELATVAAAGVRVDALVGSGEDPAERYDPTLLPRPPDLLVVTDGGRGGRYSRAGGPAGRYPAVPPPGPPVDSYGVGDTFAAALAYALGTRVGPAEALALAAGRGAACLCGRGPYRLPPVPPPVPVPGG
ncbi:PfkB family carbohydrate kinase [Allostreptomyces psammosilenae]|uniref:Ribokinase n=1 Tax=Allostreptomyces psammosilenae TaxID=1892865 RepID=A0A852ZYY3_9ACTN|nr:PfkB family carbohydrate kinase [Allostreptomyces psammosilenae]NYI07593.1 ribokinase [Allostreptomyces psammosilenae]